MERNETKEVKIVEAEEIETEAEEQKRSNKGKIIAGVVITAVTTVAVVLWKKTEARRTERTIKKLEAKGYVIEAPEDVEDETPDEE